MAEAPDLGDLFPKVAALPAVDGRWSFGADIDAAHDVLPDADAPRTEKERALLGWLCRYQPCLFGRLAAHDGAGSAASKRLGCYICWLDDTDLANGPGHVATVIAGARRQWKQAAWQGCALAFLVVFNSRSLARARPSDQLLAVARELASLYLVEFAPLSVDTIYSEAIPLRMRNGSTRLFKSTVQTFYTAAHGTDSHDRRVPGGLVLSSVGPGHYAHCLVSAGAYPDLRQAAGFVRELAYRSIGNGGIGHPRRATSSWHNRVPTAAGCEHVPGRKRPGYVPADMDPSSYSATYQTDVTLPSSIASRRPCTGESASDGEVWSALGLDYLSDVLVPRNHVNHGWFSGIAVAEEDRFGNPWQPRPAVNSAEFREHY